jgi:hypothetical protein
MEGFAFDLDEEVKGVAGEMAVGPAPVGCFKEQARMVEGFEVAAATVAQDKSALLEEGGQRDFTCGAYSRFGPGHVDFSSGVG